MVIIMMMITIQILLWKLEIIESHSMLQIYSRKNYSMEYGSEGSAARLARVQGL